MYIFSWPAQCQLSNGTGVEALGSLWKMDDVTSGFCIGFLYVVDKPFPKMHYIWYVKIDPYDLCLITSVQSLSLSLLSLLSLSLSLSLFVSVYPWVVYVYTCCFTIGYHLAPIDITYTFLIICWNGGRGHRSTSGHIVNGKTSK